MLWRRKRKKTIPPTSRSKSPSSGTMGSKVSPRKPKKAKYVSKRPNYSLLSENRQGKTPHATNKSRNKNKAKKIKKNKSPQPLFKNQGDNDLSQRSPVPSPLPSESSSKSNSSAYEVDPYTLARIKSKQSTQYKSPTTESINDDFKGLYNSQTPIDKTPTTQSVTDVKKKIRTKKKKKQLKSGSQSDEIDSKTESLTSGDEQPLLNKRSKLQKPKKQKIEKKKKTKNEKEMGEKQKNAKKEKPPDTTKTKQYKIIEITSDDEFKVKPETNLHVPKLSRAEITFLRLVANDDVKRVEAYLSEKRTDLNVNCVNFEGVSALHLAVQNGSEEMIKLLLEQPQIEIGDTMLHAVKENNLIILEMLLDAQKQISPGLEFAGASNSRNFPTHLTPLVLAAQEGNYSMVELLVSRGHTIERPHKPNCPCAVCKSTMVNMDQLETATSRLSIYQAISSPIYLIHVSSDPILSAFRLSRELASNAMAYRQLSADYLELRDRVSAFAVDLLGCCRTSHEVEVLLKQNAGAKGRRHFVFPRLLMALDYKQKEFVSHPNTQQVLETYWIGTWYSWRTTGSLRKAFIIITRIFTTPLISLLSLFLSDSRLLKHWKIPLNKLITHSAAYMLFLFILFYISNQDRTIERRGPPNTGAEPFLVLYVMGYIWSVARMCVIQGPRRFFRALWNWREILMLILFVITFMFWVKAAIECDKLQNEEIERKYWDAYDPILLAEGTFCLGTIWAFFRLMYLCQLNYHLGPLQVSLGKMTIDIYKYMMIFAILLLAFAAGLSRFYQYYDGMVYEDEFGMKTVQVSSFTSITDTINTLFWAIFCMAPIESADVVIENTKDPNNNEVELENRHSVTEKIGYFCFAWFEVMSVIVVLNMLIATMSNTYQGVNDNVAIEWTFGKTEVYVDYMSQTTLPSPYNLIPTASGLKSIIRWLRVLLTHPKGLRARWSLSYCCYVEQDVEENIQNEFPILMSVLIQRYFREKMKRKGRKHKNEVESIRREIAKLKRKINNNSSSASN